MDLRDFIEIIRRSNGLLLPMARVIPQAVQDSLRLRFTATDATVAADYRDGESIDTHVVFNELIKGLKAEAEREACEAKLKPKP